MQWTYKSLRYHLRRSVSVDRFARDNGLKPFTALCPSSYKMGIDAATFAVAWAAHHTAVTAPIISARSVAQLQHSLEARNLTLTDEVYERIAALSVRPAPATDRLEEAVF